ncbi:MAG: TIM barrel protein [Opitutaceae bacterium]|nr:TIM barrel protein [Opitutaceae bacterium]
MRTPSAAGSLTRRDFLVRAAAGSAALLASASLASAARGASGSAAKSAPAAKSAYDIGILEKWFFDGGDGGPLKYTPEQMAQTLDEMGLDLELTLRKQGHITPEKAPDELPIMAAALAKRNRRILWVALDTVRPDEPHWEKAIRTAKQLGVPQYRHRGFQYTPGKPLKPQIADFNRMAKEFAAANKEIGIQAVYQIHPGPRHAGSAAWDLDMILDGIDPQLFGVAMDTRHVMVEQGMAWPTAVHLLAPRTVALCVKSFKWDGDNVVDLPLGQGRVKKTIVDQVIAAHGGPLPICIHIEYFKNAAGRLAPVPFAERAGIVAAFKSDARVLRSWLGLPPA